MFRLAIIFILATTLVPNEALLRISQTTYEKGIDVLTFCERRPDDCKKIAEKLNEGGVILAGAASSAAAELKSGISWSVAYLRRLDEVSMLDRGTLSPDDLMPEWRGS